MGWCVLKQTGKTVQNEKRCIPIPFGKIFSFDHCEFYETCARARTYKDHKTPKNYVLEHTKPLFNKHDILALQNVYILRTLTELFKVLKYRSPISLLDSIKLNPSSFHHKLLLPKNKLSISINNFVFSAFSLWNKCIDRIFKKPILTTIAVNKGKDIQLIIPGSQNSSDLTCTVGTFKNRLKQILLSCQKSGDANEWHKTNFSTF